uniref:Uncharacterized protein n=1 Tax=viral metagenome TaxID=1070528 RepID=A0A6C0F3U8_9ZZZZ
MKRNKTKRKYGGTYVVKVLILCHTEPVYAEFDESVAEFDESVAEFDESVAEFDTFKIKGHWMNSDKEIKKILKDKMKEKCTKNIKFDTVDNLQLLINHLENIGYDGEAVKQRLNERAIDNNTNAKKLGGNFFFSDAFDPEFIKKHLSKYDVIMVPDCNNKYMNLQLKKSSDGKYELLPFILICLELTKMLKPSGTIQFSKFLEFNKCIVPNNIKVLDDDKYEALHTALKDDTDAEFLDQLRPMYKESVEYDNGHLALASALEYNKFRVKQSDCDFGKMLVATTKPQSQQKPNSSVACAVMGGKSIKTKKKERKRKVREPTVPL